MTTETTGSKHCQGAQRQELKSHARPSQMSSQSGSRKQCTVCLNFFPVTGSRQICLWRRVLQGRQPTASSRRDRRSVHEACKRDPKRALKCSADLRLEELQGFVVVVVRSLGECFNCSPHSHAKEPSFTEQARAVDRRASSQSRRALPYFTPAKHQSNGFTQEVNHLSERAIA